MKGLHALLGLLGLACKASHNLLLNLLLPLGNLSLVHLVLTRELGQGLSPRQEIQSDAELELGSEQTQPPSACRKCRSMVGAQRFL